MSTNSVNALINQQYGYATCRQYDPVFYRLHCETSCPYITESCDTPIFACKTAQQAGKEHLLGLANEEGQLVLMDAETRTKHHINAHNNAIFDLAWKFDQMQLVTASGDHTSKLYDLGDGEFRETRLFCGHTRSVRTVAFRKGDSSTFATGSRDGHIIIWDTRTEQHSFIGKPDCTIMNSHAENVNTPCKSKKKHSTSSSSGIKSVTGLVFQNSNTLISCGSGDGVIKVWDLRKHYTIQKKDPLPKYTIPYSGKTGKNGFSNLVIDSSGIRLYANCLDSTIYCYNMATYCLEPAMKYTGHQNNTFYIKSSLSRDEDYLVSGSTDENAYIWNVRYSKPIVKLTGHSAEVSCVAWCKNKVAPAVVTCSDDTTYKLWTICGLDCSDNAQGRAEVLPLPSKKKPSRKRESPLGGLNSSPKKIIWQCKNCQRCTLTNSLCENCLPPSSKRKADCELWSDSKRVGTDFGPRRLFAHLAGNFKEGDTAEQTFRILDPPDDDKLTVKSFTRALGSNKQLSCIAWSKPEEFPDTFMAQDVTKSPTTNLPNFVVDGTAPHLNYSPPKRKPQDWLTRLRIERNLRQEMLEKTVGPSSPKSRRLDLTPKSGRKTWTTPKSPLLRFFKVTNGNGAKTDTIGCSPTSHTCSFVNASSGTTLSQ